jgi:hypothetical protein
LSRHGRSVDAVQGWRAERKPSASQRGKATICRRAPRKTRSVTVEQSAQPQSMKSCGHDRAVQLHQRATLGADDHARAGVEFGWKKGTMSPSSIARRNRSSRSIRSLFSRASSVSK